jgi:hypothetical protein
MSSDSDRQEPATRGQSRWAHDLSTIATITGVLNRKLFPPNRAPCSKTFSRYSSFQPRSKDRKLVEECLGMKIAIQCPPSKHFNLHFSLTLRRVSMLVLRRRLGKLLMTNDKSPDEKSTSKPKRLSATSSLDFPVVGIGASAGGVQTLLRLFENMPSDAGMAFVIVLHLSPKHESVADQVLQRATKMRVAQGNVANANRKEPRLSHLAVKQLVHGRRTFECRAC